MVTIGTSPQFKSLIMLRQNAIPVVLVAMAGLASLGTLLSETPCNNLVHVPGQPCPTPSHYLPIGVTCGIQSSATCDGTRIIKQIFDDESASYEERNAYTHRTVTEDDTPCYKFATCYYDRVINICFAVSSTAWQKSYQSQPCHNPGSE
jgi:hypothetical protein